MNFLKKILTIGKKKAAWKKVSELKAGMKIAVAKEETIANMQPSNHSDIFFDEIISIKKVGRERVWDIEIEGTHNFVGNGILAHNTYISGNLGIGNTAPTSMFHVQGAVIGKALAIFDETGDQALLTASASGVTKFMIDHGGNVGIGTTNPVADVDIRNGDSYSYLDAGATQFTGSSSREIKENFALVDRKGILERIANAPVYTYDFKDGSVKDQMGLIAEDFYTIFGRGSDKEIRGQEVQMALWLGVQELTKQVAQVAQVEQVDVGVLEVGIGELKEQVVQVEQVEDGVLAVEMAKIEEAKIPKLTTETMSSVWPTSTSQEMSAGSLVSLAENGGAKKTEKEYDELILGVISSQDDYSTKVNVVFGGKTAVQIAPDSEPIEAGDFITSSGTYPGTAMRATKPGYAIGKALEGWDGSNKTKILVLVELGYAVPEETSTGETLRVDDSKPEGLGNAEAGETTLAQLLEEVKQFTALKEYQRLEISEELNVLGNLNVLGKTTVADLGVAGRITNGLLVIEGLAEASAGETGNAEVSAVSGASIATLSGPLRLQDTALGNLEMMGGKLIVDTKGNLISTGEITAGKYNVGTADPASASAGKAVIEKGETAIIIETTALTENSLIFVNPGSPVAVGSRKISENQFEISVKEELEKDLEVSWWVVN